VIFAMTGETWLSDLSNPVWYAVVNLTMERTNVLHGLVHLVLFLAYIVLIFD
jgi:Ca2+/H+ antiporter